MMLMSFARRLPFTSFTFTALVLFPAGRLSAQAKNVAHSTHITVKKDVLPDCHTWAERGDCEPAGRPYFMQQNCAEACYKKTHRKPEKRRISDDEQEEFYALTAKEATGKVLPLENLEGYITVLVNAARVCDYSDVFYGSLEQMHSVNPYALEILAFPFEHPGIDVDSCRDEIHADEKLGGRKIHIMDAVNINGPETHPVYNFLKKLFGLKDLDPSVAHYFFINPDVTLIEHHHGASYKTLKAFVDLYLKAFYESEL